VTNVYQYDSYVMYEVWTNDAMNANTCQRIGTGSNPVVIVAISYKTHNTWFTAGTLHTVAEDS